VAKNAFRQVRSGGGLFAELLRQPLKVCTIHRGKEPPEPARRRLRCPLPEARGQCRLGRRALHQDGPSHQCQFGQPLPTLWRKDELPCRSQHLFGRQGQPFHRPAITIEGLQVGTRQRQRGVQEQRLVKTRIMDEDGAEGWRARLGVGAYQVVPKCRVQRQGGGPKTELPGFVAVRGRRGHGAPLIRAWEGADQRATDGFAPLPLLHGEGRPSRREVDGRTHDIALDACRLKLSEGEPAIADQRFVGRQLRVGPLEQARL
jgi:hypothetical protein